MARFARRAQPSPWATGPMGVIAAAVATALNASPFSTPGTPAVTPSGAATYSIPLFGVKGTSGMEPKLALSYSSQAGDGPMGVGWSVQGLSAISRCPATREQDGFNGSINFNANDRYCLDGQRLVLTGGSCPIGGTEMRTEIESFSQVCAFGSVTQGVATHFIVRTKAGLTLWYGTQGGAGDGAILAQGRSLAQGAMLWPVNRITDVKGNYYKVTYGQDQANGSFWVDRIDYTGNDAGGATLTPYASVQFTYVNRDTTFTPTAWVGGSMVRPTKLLTQVATYEGANLARAYTMTYTYSGAAYRPRLGSVQESAQGGLAKQPTTVTWQVTDPNSAANFNASGYSVSGNLGGPNHSFNMLLADFNADGKLDAFWVPMDTEGKVDRSGYNWPSYVWLGVGPNYTGYTQQWNVPAGCAPLLGDFNNDGRTDVIWYPRDIAEGAESGYGGSESGYLGVVDCSGGSGAAALWTSNGDGNFTSSALTENAIWNNIDRFVDWRPQVGDFNGDGVQDILWLRTTATGYGQGGSGPIWYGNGNGTFTNGQLTSVPYGLSYGAHLGDFNGDGLTDILWDPKLADGRSAGGGRQIWINNGSSLPYPAGYTMLTNPGDCTGAAGGCDALFSAGWVPTLIDMNGDGKTDIFWEYKHANGTHAGHMHQWTSKGNGTFTTAWNIAGVTTSLGAGNYGTTLADVNGDGRPDLIWDTRNGNNLSTGTRSLWLNMNGASFSSVLPNSLAGADGTYLSSRPTVADFDGDGRPDILLMQMDVYGRVNGQLGLYSSTVPTADLVAAITEGQAASGGVSFATTQFHYATLAKSQGRYTKGSGAVYPKADLIGAMPITITMSIQQGSPGTRSFQYYYWHARAHMRGRGFLGFEHLQTHDSNTSAPTLSGMNNISQDFPYIGSPGQSYQYVHNGTAWVAVRSTTNTYAQLTSQGGRPFPYVAWSWEVNTDLDGGVISRSQTGTTYDNLGNATQVVVSSQDAAGIANGYAKTTVSVYNNDLTNWRLARLSCAAVTSAMPGSSAIRVSGFTYFSDGLLATETVEPGTPCGGVQGTTNAALRLTTTYGYDAWGNITSKTASSAVASGQAGYFAPRTVSTAFDTTFRRTPITTTKALGHTESRVFNGIYGDFTSVTDVNGVVTTFTFDALGRKTSQSTPTGGGNNLVSRWIYSLCASGCGSDTTYSLSTFARVNDTGNYVSQYKTDYYDRLNRANRGYILNFSGANWYSSQDTHRDFDVLGRVVRRYLPTDFATMTCCATQHINYDSVGRVSTTIDSDPVNYAAPGAQTTMTYGSRPGGGARVTVTNALGQITERLTNSQGQLVSVIQAKGTARQTTTSYAFDALGNLTQTTDPLGNVSTVTYDIRGRKTAMADPDAGAWSYVYNALGELVSQTDAKNQTTTLTYDLLGRVTQKSAPDLVSTFSFDTFAPGCSSGAVKGVRTRAQTSTGYDRRVCTDTLARPITETAVIGIGGGPTLTTRRAYDSASRLSTLTYPNGLIVRHNYNANSYLASIQELDVKGTVLATPWTANAINARGQVTSETAGNGRITLRTYDHLGRLSTFKVGTSGTPGSIQDATVTFDLANNLTTRGWFDGSAARSESFLYDELNRLTQSTVSGQSAKTVTYDLSGNILTKTGIGTYTYPTPGLGAVRPHAVSSVSGSVNAVTNPGYTYDANGNLTQERQNGNGTLRRSLTWASYNLPTQIVSTPAAGNTVTASFWYGPDKERVRQVEVNGTTTTTTFFSSGFEQVHNSSTGITESRAYVQAGGRLVAIRTTRSSGAPDTRYVHDDHLGSLSILTTETGAVVQYLSYDAWGKRRNPNGTDASGLIAAPNPRGFTGHEHLDRVAFIHMGGRIYDPSLGRFIQPDPFVQEPENGQNLNRYIYVLNNPLSYTDPSGYFFKKLFRAAIAVGIAMVAPQAFGALMNAFGGQWAIAGTFTTFAGGQAVGGGLLLTTAGSIAAGAAGGLVAGLVVSGGDLQAGLQGALTGGAFSYAGTLQGAQQFAAHAGTGCVSGAMSGGGCGRGALSAMVGKTVTISTATYIGSLEVSGPARTALHFASTVVAGGAASSAAGGKFENGATTAAFGYLFNYCGTEGACWRQAQEQFGRAWRRVFIDPFGPDYATNSTGILSVSATTAVNLRDGTTFVGGGVTQQDPRSVSWRPGGSASLGWIFGSSTDRGVSDFLGGHGAQAFLTIPTGTPVSAFFAITHSYGGATALEIGFAPGGRLSGGVMPLGYSREWQR